MPAPQNLDEIVAAAERVLTQVNEARESWRFPLNMNHAVATAGLTRAAELIDEALDLAGRRRSVGANILVRSAFECWLTGTWALFGGDDALVGIEQERIRNERSLIGSVEIGRRGQEHLDRQTRDLNEVVKRLLGSDEPSSVKFQAIADALPPLIEASEEVDVRAVYDLLYRSHSTYDAHPWKVLGQYVREDGLGLRVQPTGPWQEPRVSAALLTMYVAVLGRWIDRARGGDGTAWDEAVSHLEGLLRSDGFASDHN